MSHTAVYTLPSWDRRLYLLIHTVYHLHHIRVLPSLCFFESHSLFLSFADDDQTSFLSHVFVRPCINVLVPSTCCWSQCWSFALDSFLASALMLFPRVINNCWWNTLSTLLTVWRWPFTRIFHPTADKNQEIELKKQRRLRITANTWCFRFSVWWLWWIAYRIFSPLINDTPQTTCQFGSSFHFSLATSHDTGTPYYYVQVKRSLINS